MAWQKIMQVLTYSFFRPTFSIEVSDLFFVLSVRIRGVITIYEESLHPWYVMNSWLLLVSLYSRVWLNFLAPFLSGGAISNLGYGFSVFLFLLALIVNQFRVSRSFVAYILGIVVYALANAIMVSYKSYVLTELVAMIASSFLPIYIITLGHIDYQYIVKSWKRVASFLTIIFPVFVVFYTRGFITYADIGHYSHLNILPIGFFLLIKREKRFTNFLLFLINGTLGLVLGSRALVATSIILLFFMVLTFTRKNFKYYFFLVVLGISLVTVFTRLEQILGSLYSFTTNLGLNSRNLFLFIRQLEGVGFEAISAGRSDIYTIILQFIKDRSGFPAGLGAARYATSGSYYYSHNVFFDFILIFGVLGALAFFLWYAHKTFRLAVLSRMETYEFMFFFCLSVSFWLQSLFGAYFITHQFFYVSLAILISQGCQHFSGHVLSDT